MKQQQTYIKRFLSFASAFLLIGIGSYFLLNRDNRSSRSGKKYKIVFHAYSLSLFTETIQEEFLKELKKVLLSPHQVDIYNAASSPTLMNSQLEESLNSEKYDLIFSVGGMCTPALHNKTEKKKYTIPIVFAGSKDPKQTEHITGISFSEETVGSIKQKVNLLMLLKPNTKKVIITYDPTINKGATENEAKLLEQGLSKHKVKATAITVDKGNQVCPRIAPLLPGTDVVMTLVDSTETGAIQGIIKLCEQYKITLFTSDLDSTQKGAGYVAQILEQKKKPSELPIKLLSPSCKVVLNKQAMVKQNLIINDDLLRFLVIITVHDDNKYVSNDLYKIGTRKK